MTAGIAGLRVTLEAANACRHCAVPKQG